MDTFDYEDWYMRNVEASRIRSEHITTMARYYMQDDEKIPDSIEEQCKRDAIRQAKKEQRDLYRATHKRDRIGSPTRDTIYKYFQSELNTNEPIHIHPSDDGGFPYLINRRRYSEVAEELQARCNTLSYCGLSVTFIAKYQNNLDEDELRNIVYRAMIERNIKHFTLFPDMDEGGNFHYHGVIEIPLRNRKSFKQWMTRNIGYIKYDYLRDPAGWFEYCRKDVGFKSRKQPIPLKKPVYTEKQIVEYLVSDNGRNRQPEESDRIGISV